MAQHKHWRATKTVQARARELRKELTPPERALWSRLRRKQLYGLRFRRQHPIGSFIVDFYCASRNVVIELDGRTHDTREAYDGTRTEWLEERGYRVIRFTNDEVTRNLEGVLAEIARACGVELEEPPP